jgi:hypothetical protein
VKRLAIGLVAAVACTAAGVVAQAVLGPDPAKQAQADGCARSRQQEFARLGPGWVYVGDKDVPATSPSPPARWLAGVVDAYGSNPDDVHPSGGDDPTTHDSFDINFNVRPDPGYEDLLGGLPDADTGNYYGGGEERDRIQPEREQLGLPTYVWPEVGNHVQLLGSWVWDCGHWDPEGERTEIHPFRALWTERASSRRSPYGESEGDLFVTTDATPAGQIAECAHRTKGDQQAYKACTYSQPKWLDVSADYVLTLKAPPRPKGAKQLAVRVVDRGSTTDPRWAATIANGKLTLRFHLTSTFPTRVVVAKQVCLGWRPLQKRQIHLRVTFTKVLIRRAQDPGCKFATTCGSVQTTREDQITTAPGELIVFTDVAGQWAQWPVLSTRDGRSYAVKRTTDVWVGRSEPWRLFVFPHECDFGVASWSDPGKPMAPCPKTKEFGNFGGDDIPGEVIARYRGANGIGTHAANGNLGSPSTCPVSNTQGCWRLWWTIERVRG